MEILFWLLPAAVVTLAAMAWVGWWGRESRGAVTDASREAAARRLGEALSREQTSHPGYAVPPRDRDRVSGVAVRPSKVRPVIVPGGGEKLEETVVVTPGETSTTSSAASADEQAARDRRAS